ncbi:MAG: mannonate dehydratase, partial [Anaerolineae bacterium]
MELALAISTLEHEELSYVAQLGVKSVILGGTGITEQLQWDYISLLNVKSRLDLYGLKIAGIENIPEALWRDARVGGPNRDQQIEHVLEIIRTLGRLGVPIFAYNWSPIINVWGHYRHGQAGGGRGGAGLTSFDYELVKGGPLTDAGEISAEEILRNHVYFLQAAVPVAEQVHVKLAVHPNDPPAPVLRGLGRHMISVESYQ